MRFFTKGPHVVIARDALAAADGLPRVRGLRMEDITDALIDLCKKHLPPAQEGVSKIDVFRQYQLRLSDGSLVYGDNEAINELKAQLFEVDATDKRADQHFADLELERIAHGRSRDRVEELFKQKAEADERAATLGRELCEGAAAAAQVAARVVELEKQLEERAATAKRRLDQIGELNEKVRKLGEELMERPTQERLDFALSVVEKLEAEVARQQDEIAAWKNLAPIETTPAKKQVEATKAFLAGEDVTGAAPIVMARPADIALSPLATRHGSAVMQLLDSGHNPDEVCAELNRELSRNDRLNPAMIKRIKTEMRAAQNLTKGAA
ncbi:hypothetical protein PQU92_08145 [Asticcacaulis sp. BYS171W]|uniref:Uncharacterized protein n=1 Tax=Asticcacaulis aquaticus TaxID=2984212 RepID=A0ABT5HTB6_9CAUL|nr:hypothetical protein [Asticcacaulis aquaticus]MDC7683244.1 hypothetical protein [Asticcacaulis aquaticus]